MSWLRRVLLLAGLVTGAWLLGGAGEASADVRVEIDQLRVEVKLPVVEIGLKIETAPQPRPQPVPPKPDPRVETPEPPAAQQTPEHPPATEPVRAEAPQQQHSSPPHQVQDTRPTNPVPAPQQPQPQAEQPITGTLPQSGAGATAGGTQIPAGTLPQATRPPTTTASLVSTEQHDVPHVVRAEEKTFSPD